MPSQKQSKKLRKLLRQELEKYKPQIEEEAQNRRIRAHAKGGLVHEKLGRKDYIFHKAFPKREEVLGGTDVVSLLKPLGRIGKIRQDMVYAPPTFQGYSESCVPASAVEVVRYYTFYDFNQRVNLDWQYIYNNVPRFQEGTKISDVLQFLKNHGVPEVGVAQEKKAENAMTHRIKGYFKLVNREPSEVYRALQKGLVMIGVNAREAGISDRDMSHEVTVVDVTEDGNRWIILNHWDDVQQLIQEIPISVNLINAVLVYDPQGVNASKSRLGLWGAFTHSL